MMAEYLLVMLAWGKVALWTAKYIKGRTGLLAMMGFFFHQRGKPCWGYNTSVGNPFTTKVWKAGVAKGENLWIRFFVILKIKKSRARV